MTKKLLVDATALILLACLCTPAPALAQNPGDAGSGSSVPNTAAGNAAGASGDNDSFNLPKGALIALVTTAAVVAVIGIASATLFYIAKKRQWEIRKSLRRSARRFTGSLAPPSSQSRRASRHQRGVARIVDEPETSQSKSQSKLSSKSGPAPVSASQAPSTRAPAPAPLSASAPRDLEKGEPVVTSSFEVESPPPQKFWNMSVPLFSKKRDGGR
ncbi:MAG: hypothetical protein M1838_001984 [Thelocarpon superellum]|nr:MAG: hypothetical protein M1838_001984 [Thelocarpon superellum]